MKVSIMFSKAVLVFGIFASVVDGRVGVRDIENDNVKASTQAIFHTKATQNKELLRGHMLLSTVPTKDPLPPGHPPGPAPFDDNLIAHTSDNAGSPHKTDEKRLIKIFDNNVMDSAVASDAGITSPNAGISHEEGEKSLLQADVGQCSDTYNCNCNWDWCHRRALMGTCTSPDNFLGHNSDFMDANCCNSCRIMANNPDSLCVNLHSNNGQCNWWANNGECLRNPLWMHNECCHSCAESCTDTHLPPRNSGIEDCALLALGGRCTEGWVRNECCHTCMLNEAAPSLVVACADRGCPCNTNNGCDSGTCEGGVCFARDAGNGEACLYHRECASGRCAYCEGTCRAKLGNGGDCFDYDDCISGYCFRGTCWP